MKGPAIFPYPINLDSERRTTRMDSFKWWNHKRQAITIRPAIIFQLIRKRILFEVCGHNSFKHKFRNLTVFRLVVTLLMLVVV